MFPGQYSGCGKVIVRPWPGRPRVGTGDLHVFVYSRFQFRRRNIIEMLHRPQALCLDVARIGALFRPLGGLLKELGIAGPSLIRRIVLLRAGIDLRPFLHGWQTIQTWQPPFALVLRPIGLRCIAYQFVAMLMFLIPLSGVSQTESVYARYVLDHLF